MLFFIFLTGECVCNYAHVSNGSTDTLEWFLKKRFLKKKKISDLARAQTTSYENCNQTTDSERLSMVVVGGGGGACAGWWGPELHPVL